MARRLANAFLLCWGAALYVWYRRVWLVARPPDEGLLTEPIPTVPPLPWERVVMPPQLPFDD